MNLHKNERSKFAQFRCGVLPLRIETGRFVGVKPEDRLCHLCNNNTQENETPFLLDCSLYTCTSLREYWFKDVISNIPQNFWKQIDNSDKMKY